ncbi:hypothetical protein C8Q73DRAFT_838269 [Cubamyces lactineus]|nr:hypothetical protein C8Q73DRAFT_838269 [Cubamyces lactineus]
MRRHLGDSRRFTVGPMPIEEFIDCFLPPMPPGRLSEILSSRRAFKMVPSAAPTPAEIYGPLLEALSKSTKHKSRAPGLVFANASARSENPHEPGYMKPHICCYTASNADLVAQSPIPSRADLGYAELFIEVKPDAYLDFFVDPPYDATAEELASHEFVAQHEPYRTQQRVVRSFGQHIMYAAEILARQHRTFVFSITMAGSAARLCRWDRSGLIVSRSFDIREHPDFLCEFLARFACASNSQRGHDETVEMATSEEETLFLETITKHVQAQLGVEGDALAKAVSEHYEPGHVMAMHVHAVDMENPQCAGSTERFLVSRPVTVPLYVYGKCTRGYWATQAATGRVVFLKDTWRLPGDQEGTVLSELNAAGVRNVPTVLAYGDVYVKAPPAQKKLTLSCVQHTKTDHYCRKPWACPVLNKKVAVSTHIHYRLVVGEVGYGLERLRGTQELLGSTYDVFHAMRDASDKAKRIHRDISVRNIVLIQEVDGAPRKGYLIDWETSDHVDEQGHAFDRVQTGTWKFMSMKILENPERGHTLQDDMESLLYVILYCSLLYLPHNIHDPADLHTFIYEFFDYFSCAAGRLHGGDAKLVNAGDRTWIQRVKFTSENITDWLNMAMDYHFPPRHLRREWWDRWSNPDYLDTFWGAFMERRDLEKDDAVQNKVKKPIQRIRTIEDSRVPFIPPTRANVDNDATLRLAQESHPARVVPHKRPLGATISPPLRRSERLRAQLRSSKPTRTVASRPRPTLAGNYQQEYSDGPSKRTRIC